MAITWGSAVSTSSNGARLGYEITLSPSRVGYSTSSVKATLKLYIGTKRSVYDSTNSYSLSGDFSGSGNVNISHGSSSSWSGANVTQIGTFTKTVSASFTSTVRIDFSASMTGINAVPGTMRVSGRVYAAKRPIGAPATPSAMAATRNSDTQFTLNWTNSNPSSVSNPYSNVEIYRWDNVTAKWRLLTTVGVVSSYIDRSSIANRRYSYKVRAKNSAGTSGYKNISSYINTTPSPPTTPNVTKSIEDIRLSWNNTATNGTGVEVWEVIDGVLQSSRLAYLSGQPTSWTHVGPDVTKTHAYRLKAVGSAPTLYSSFSGQSKTVQLLARPNPATNLTPSGKAYDAAEDLTLKWRHNPQDDTDQTAFEIQHKQSGGSWTSTGKITSTASEWLMPAGTYPNGVQVDWQVRTWGQFAGSPAYSNWSTSGIIPFSTRPTSAIQSPSGIYNSSVLEVIWEFYDVEDTVQAEWAVELRDGNQEIIERRVGIGPLDRFTFSTLLEDETTYNVWVALRDGSGLWSTPNIETFTVEFLSPPNPEIVLSWIPDIGSVIVQVINPVPDEGFMETIDNEVWQSRDGVDWVLIADVVPPNSTITDYVPVLGEINYYRVVAYSELRSTSHSMTVSVGTTPTQGYVWINGGPAFANMIRLRYNPSMGMSYKRAKTLNKFAGRRLPVETVGEQRERTITYGADLADDTSPRADIEGVVDLPAPICFRTPSGHKYYVSIDDTSFTEGVAVESVSFSMTEVDLD